MNMSFQKSHDYSDLPEHVRRIIERDGEIEFTPPSFERWLGRLQMLRTISSMAAFMFIWLISYGSGLAWETATVRGIIAAVAFHFIAWAVGLFVFGEIYDAEVKTARKELEAKERERARRIESYYRERLRAQDSERRDLAESANQPVIGANPNDPITAVVPSYVPTSALSPEPSSSPKAA